jgi:hypothetical protein
VSQLGESLTIVGTVTKLEITDNGAGSVELFFSVAPLKGAGESLAFACVTSKQHPVGAIAAFLTVAYASKLVISVSYIRDADAVRRVQSVKVGVVDESSSGRIGFT